jgi:hypothetical protein
MRDTPERLIAVAEAGRKCVRQACRADVHPSDGPHLCKDLRERMARQEKAIGRIEAILRRTLQPAPFEPVYREAAEAIYKAIAGISFE